MIAYQRSGARLPLGLTGFYLSIE